MSTKEEEAEFLRIIAEITKERTAAQRLRAEIASVTASLEIGKKQVETALHVENDLKSPPLISDPSSAMFEEVADAEEETTTRSLESQLQATQKTLDDTLKLEQALEAEIKVISDNASAEAEIRKDTNESGGTARIASELKKAASASRGSISRERMSAINWRERTLPNLTLITEQKDSDSFPSMRSGIVVERVFEGIVAFTSVLSKSTCAPQTALSSSQPEEIHLQNVSDIENATEKIVANVASQYGSLTIQSQSSGDEVRLVAVLSALEYVRHLLETHIEAPTPSPDDGNGSLMPRDDESPSQRSPLINSSSPRNSMGESSFSGTTTATSMLVPEPVASPPRLSHGSRVLSQDHFGRLLQASPSRYRNCDLKRLYCTATDGTSLATLYKKVSAMAPTIVCVRDTNGNAFGCYASSPWKDSSARYYGTGETFVFKVSSGNVCIYKWARSNSFFQLSSRGYFAVGGGGHFALWIDDELQNGTTAQCSTFKNTPLCQPSQQNQVGKSNEESELIEFEIVALEVWTPVITGHA